MFFPVEFSGFSTISRSQSAIDLINQNHPTSFSSSEASLAFTIATVSDEVLIKVTQNTQVLPQTGISSHLRNQGECSTRWEQSSRPPQGNFTKLHTVCLFPQLVTELNSKCSKPLASLQTLLHILDLNVSTSSQKNSPGTLTADCLGTHLRTNLIPFLNKSTSKRNRLPSQTEQRPVRGKRCCHVSLRG